MKFTKNIALSLLLLIAGLQAAAGGIQQNNSTIVAPQEKSIALQMIEAMQGCIFFNKSIQNQLIALNTMKYLTGKPVLVLGDKAKLDQVEKQNIEAIKEQNTIFSEATALYHKYINELRQTYNKIKRPALTNLPKMQESTNLIEQLTLQSNQSKALFTRLLDEYLVHLGNVYEKKSGLLGLYRNVYSIASSDDHNLSITPHEYLALVQTLDNATRQGDWGKTINLTFAVVQENGSVVEKNLTLNEITTAIKQVPLPASYYATALKVAAGVAAGAAIVGGAYYAYNNPQAFGLLQGKVTDVETKLDTASVVDQAPVEQNVVANPAPVTRVAPSFEEFMKKHIDLGNINVNQDQPVEQNWISNANQDQSVEQNWISEEALADMTKPRTVQDWQAGGDQENYGLSGYSDLDAQGVTTLSGIAGLTKSGAITVGTRLGSSAKVAPVSAPAATPAVGTIPAKAIETPPTMATLAQTRIGAQLENLPASYVQPAAKTATTEITKSISPTWAVNFGQ